MLITFIPTEQNYIKQMKYTRLPLATLWHTDTHTHTHKHTLCTYFHSKSRAHQFTDSTKLVAMKVNCHQQQHLTKWCS